MEDYLVFAAIGGLLFLTLFINSVSEAYEQKKREKRIKILRIKQGLDEISDLLESLNSCDVSNEINELLGNEIMSRVQLIQQLDHQFRGIDALLEEANSEPLPVQKDKASFHVKDESELKAKLVLLHQLIRVLSSPTWHSSPDAKQLEQFIIDLKLLRCEKIFQFYTDKATKEANNGRFLIAKEHYYYILHALKQSSIEKNPRVLEIMEQVEFMMTQVGKPQAQIQQTNDELAAGETATTASGETPVSKKKTDKNNK